MEKAGNRGHGIFSYLRSLGANVPGKFLTAIPADITPEERRHRKAFPVSHLTIPYRNPSPSFPFHSPATQFPFPAAQESCSNVLLSRGCREGQERVGPGDAPFPQGGNEGGRTVPAWAACALSWLPHCAAQPDSCVAF